MGLQISWSIEGDKQLSRRLRNVSSDVKDLKKPFDQSARKLRKIFANDVFRTEGGIIDEKWARLSPATVARKARSGGGILVDTGRMKNSFRYRSAKDHAIIWNPTRYFKYHQSNKPRRRIPRRVMMKLAGQQRQMVVRIFHKYIRESVDKRR